VARNRKKSEPAADALEHCDNYIHDFKAPLALRVFLLVNRMPAVDKMLINAGGFNPTLYADYEGKIYRVTMASRLGDVGISENLGRDTGYDRRVPLSALTNFRGEP